MLPRKLNCEQVKEIVRSVFKGVAVYELADRFKVGSATISNVLYRVSYKECYDPLDDFASEELYLQSVREILEYNSKMKPRMDRK